MQSNHVVLLQSDPGIAKMLLASLNNSFQIVHLVESVDGLRHAAAKHHPQALVVDLESAGFAEIESLKHEFNNTRIVCNHRVADEQMWTRTLNAGGDDCCSSSDTRSILAAVMPPAARSVAA